MNCTYRSAMESPLCFSIGAICAVFFAPTAARRRVRATAARMGLKGGDIMLSQRRIRNLPAAFDTFALVAALAGAVTACEEPLPTEAPGEPRLPPPKAFLHSARELGSPLPFLNAYEARLFEQGSATFQMVFTPATGLGPLFNGRSCADCHEDPVVGGVGDAVETHAPAYTG